MCDRDHRPLVAHLSFSDFRFQVSSFRARLGMKNRVIAVFILASLVCWSVPGAMAASSRTPISQEQTQHTGAGMQMQDHACCPGVHLRIVPGPLVTPTPAEMPCEQHPCCAKQAPGTQPPLPASTRMSRPDLDGVHTTAAERGLNGQTGIATKFSNSTPRDSSALSTVLRI